MTKLPTFFDTELSWLIAAQEDPAVTPEEWSTRGNALLARVGELTPKDFKEFDRRFSAMQEKDSDRELTVWLHEQLSDNKPQMLETDGRVEQWKVGEVALSVPALHPSLDEEARAAVERRRQADFEGRCPCGGVGKVEKGLYVIDHRADCSANDQALRTTLEKVGFFLK